MLSDSWFNDGMQLSSSFINIDGEQDYVLMFRCWEKQLRQCCS